MKLLFIHDYEKLKQDKDGNYYTDGSYTPEVWQRYYDLFDEVSVIFRKDPEIYENEYLKQKFQPFNKEKISYIELPSLTSTISSYFSLRKHNEVHKIIKNAILQNDCLIVRLPSVTGHIAINYAKKYNKPYLVELVGCPWDALWNHSVKGKILAPFYYFKTKNCVKNAKYVLYVTDIFLQHRYPSRGKSIGCSDVSLLPNEDNVLKQRINKINNMVKNQPIVIGTIGAVNVKHKGQSYAIKAISKLNKQGYNYEYHLVGAGDNSYLKSVAEKYKVADKVKFIGSLTHDDIFKYLDNIDIYIQPSKQEGLPRALIEAMSRACPAIGSNAGGIPELIKYVFHKGSVDELCNLLEGFSKTKMIEDANRNFQKSKEYDKKLLDRKRQMFYKEFAQNVENNFRQQFIYK